MSNKVFLIDHVGWMGHHSMYNKELVRAFALNGWSVKHIGSDPEDLINWTNSVLPSKKVSTAQLKLSFLRTIVYRLFQKLINDSVNEKWLYLYLKLRQHGYQSGDLVFIVSGDDFLKPTNRVIRKLLPNRWITLAMFVKSHEINNYAPYSQQIFHLNEETIQQSSLTNLSSFPDFSSTDKTDVKKPFNDQRSVIGLFGGLSKRKGLLSLLEVAKSNQGFNFLFVGRIIENSFNQEELCFIKNMIDTERSNVRFILNNVRDLDFNGYLAHCQILYCAYENFDHSSNILTKGAYFKIPLIGLKDTYIGNCIERYKIGQVIENTTEQAISSCLNDSKTASPQDHSGFNTYYEQNSIEYMNSLIKSIQ